MTSILEMPPIFLSVSELNTETKQLLESTFGFVWVKGELSNFLSYPRSGHWYFSLKDAHAQVRCAMFKGANLKVSFSPADGQEVMVLAKVSLYPDRGDYQLIVEKMEATGDGELKQAFERLKSKLLQEGLFDPQHKKILPPYPTRIGIITSPTGAAIQDIISVLSRRSPCATLLVYPCQVQGQRASLEIVQAIQLANTHANCDVLILARGGGSLEDLWCFNDERVARAIFTSQIPIISGIGHEIDFTIADFVADYRAPTPSAAAEMISLDQSVLIKQFDYWHERLTYSILQIIQLFSQKIDYLDKQLISPQQSLQKKSSALELLKQRLQWAIQKQLQKYDYHFKQLVYALGAVNPFATLGRGYSITRDIKTHHLISSIKNVQMGDEVATRLQDGWLISKVLKIKTLEDLK